MRVFRPRVADALVEDLRAELQCVFAGAEDQVVGQLDPAFVARQELRRRAARRECARDVDDRRG